MAKFIVLLLTVVSTCLAQPADNNAKERSPRAPQSQIQYSDPDGSQVNWKLYAPQNQWRSHLESSRRLQRQETGTGQGNFSPKQQVASVVQAPLQSEPQYQPFSAVPNHIKRLISESYNHEGPYVDPGAFFYQAVVPSAVAPLAAQPGPHDQTAHSQTHQLEKEYFNSAVNYRASGYQGNNEQSTFGQVGRVPPKAGIEYKDEDRLSQRSTTLPYGSSVRPQSEKTQYQPYKQVAQPQASQLKKQNSQIQSRYPQISQTNHQRGQYSQQQFQHEYKQQLPIKPVSEINYDRNMPMAIQQLLSYQAQLPYNVIANHIIYRPKQLFIPKPLPESAKLSKQYPSKIYYLKTDGQIYDGPEIIKEEKNDKRY